MELARADNRKVVGGGKPDDLQESTQFHVLATKGAVYLPHVDRHGAYTTTLNEEGEKLWVMWPNLVIAELYHRPQSQELPAPLGVYLEPDMSGTMHWHIGKLPEILKATKAAIEVPGITNEGMAASFY
ncbi:hypothetical protein ACKRZS_007077 [Fusarium odoratissimum]